MRGWLLFASLVRCGVGADIASACEDGVGPAVVRAAVGNATLEETFAGCPEGGDEESCICGALRLEWPVTAKRILTARMLRKESAASVRRFAQRKKDGAVAVLARLHQRYPYHLKMLPALEWAQSAEAIFVRVRYARYTRGEPLTETADAFELRFSDTALYVVAEGSEKPLYISSSLRWRHPLRRRDGCTDKEAQCTEWAASGACEQDALWASAPFDPACADTDASCQQWAQSGECEANRQFMQSSCPLSCAVCRNGPLLAERCQLSCGHCPAANGSLAVDAVWAHVPGGLVFEARKGDAGVDVSDPNRHAMHWDRLLEAKHPPNRIDGAAEAFEVGTLLACNDKCTAATEEEPKCRGAEGAAGCAERCRQQCSDELAGRWAVR